MKNFKLCYFAVIFIYLPGYLIQANEFKIEQIQPVIDGDFILLLNKIESIVSSKIKPDESPIYFNEIEITYLKESYTNSKIRVKAFNKYNDRIISLQCVNTLIWKSISYDFQFLMPDNGILIAQKKAVIKSYKRYMRRMLSLLYFGRIKPYKWIIKMYLKLLAILEKCNNERLLEVKFFFHETSIENDVSDFYFKCEKYNYIPKRLRNLEEGSFYKLYIVDDLMKQLYDNTQNMIDAYKYEHLFAIDNISLIALLNDYNVIFEWNIGMSFDWTKTKTECNVYENKIHNLYNNNKWLENPISIASFHLLFQKVVYTQVLQFVVFHLQSFSISWVSGCCINCLTFSSKKTDDIKTQWKSLIEPLKNAMQLLHAEDSLFSSILEFVENKLPWSNNLSRIIFNALRVLIYCLKQLHVPLKPKPIYIMMSCEKKKDINFNTILGNINAFNSCIQTIRDLLKPVESLYTIKFFWSDILLAENNQFFPIIKTYD
ncbi:uncharacterized protein LOC126899468 [Daktulosphaira vitifoliae]|uniref:uncharacterized protein LOC126899468 n=1 Tax=Daktulosphaira vitifoliae TaxID=58002 RepID=UPI0021A9FCE7|nr:uncharacterized protein LOC126899468 [Daktulosphaira vitifoliae]